PLSEGLSLAERSPYQRRHPDGVMPAVSGELQGCGTYPSARVNQTREEPCRGPCLADRELELLRDALREHVSALAVDVGPRAPSTPDSLVRAANYITSVFEDAGLSVREQNYIYGDQRVTNLLATVPETVGATTYYVVGAHYDTVPGTPGADDNASAVAVLLE